MGKVPYVAVDYPPEKEVLIEVRYLTKEVEDAWISYEFAPFATRKAIVQPPHPKDAR